MRRKVIYYLIDRVDVTFPEDWAEGETVREVIKKWLFREASSR